MTTGATRRVCAEKGPGPAPSVTVTSRPKMWVCPKSRVYVVAPVGVKSGERIGPGQQPNDGGDDDESEELRTTHVFRVSA